jgi:hypothetical protein
VHRDDPARPDPACDRRGPLAADRRTAADREEGEVDVADRGRLLVAQRRLAEVAEVRDAQPAEREDEDRVRAAPRPGDLVVLEATASTSPIGDSRRPAVERRTGGSPPIAPTALWSPCSCVTSSRSAATPAIGG